MQSTSIDQESNTIQTQESNNSSVSFTVPLERSRDQENVDLVNIIDAPDWKTVLFDLVRKEKMDPWNIDIILLADKFIEKINSMDTSDLRLPANAILASAILLKAKAKVLKFRGMKEADWEDMPIVVDDMIDVVSAERDNSGRTGIYGSSDAPSLSPQRLVEGRVSLNSLVGAIESILEKSSSRGTRKLQRGKVDFNLEVHEADIEDKVDSLYEKIVKMSQNQEIILFSDLLERDDAIGIIHTLLPLLFMTNKELIKIWQEEFFGEIMVSLN